MTKAIRIENADASVHHKVRVVTQIRNAVTGEWENSGTPTPLDYPTAMVNETIWDSKRLVVEEYK